MFKDGTYELTEPDALKRYDPNEVLELQKFDPETIVNAVYYEGERGWTVVKRFQIETTSLDQRFSYLSEHKDSKLLYVSTDEGPRIQYAVKVKNKRMEGEVNLAEFMDVKGWRAIGNKLSDQKLTSVKEMELEKSDVEKAEERDVPDKLHAGDSVEFDVTKNGEGQGKLFED